MFVGRRTLLTAFLTSPLLHGAGCSQAREGSRVAERTPACGDDEGPTPAQEDGPFFRPGAPDRHTLAEPGFLGTPITLAGAVVDQGCRPVPDALVQIWHADSQGEYDLTGQRFRGVQRTDAAGRWWFATIVPALYPGRTRHVHFKILPPGGALLTTQLYFPDEPRNARDSLFDTRLLLEVARTTDGQFGRFDFVV